MLKLTGDYRKNSITMQLVMVMILVYPILFSFTHSLSHHLFASHHHSTPLTDNRRNIVAPENNKIQTVYYNNSLRKCPICDYEFALGIEPVQTPIPQIAVLYASSNFQVAEEFNTEECCNSTSPRAPPCFS